MNSIKFKASLFAKHWTYQTLNEYINASVGILPIEKYKQLLKFAPQTLLISQVLRRFFSLHEKGMTVKLSMRIIQSNPSQTYDVFNSKRMSKYQMKNKIKFASRSIYCCGCPFQVLCQMFFTATNSKDCLTFDGKSLAKGRDYLLVDLECVNA